MTPKTLTKERQEKFIDAIQSSQIHYYARLYLEHAGNTSEYVENTLNECREILSKELVNASLSRSEIQAEYKHPIDKMDTWLEFEKPAQRLKDAQIEFETQLGFNPAWSKPDWEKQNKKIADLLDKDPNVLKDFALWRKGEGKYQGLTNASMAKTATFFMDVAYPTFLASVAMSGNSNTPKNQNSRNLND